MKLLNGWNGRTLAVALGLGLAASGSALGQDAPEKGKSRMADAQRVGDVYPLAMCVVTDEPLDAEGKPVVKLHEGREIRFCCKGCVRKFDKDPAAYLAEVDAAIVEQQLATYPLETCVVSGEALGEMGEPVNKVVGNRLVRLCCDHCIEALEKDPAKYLKKLDEAVIEKQAAAYPVQACVVSGEPLDAMGGPVNYVIGTHLLQLCCGHCVPKIEAEPTKYLREVYGDTFAPTGESHHGHEGHEHGNGHGDGHGGDHGHDH